MIYFGDVLLFLELWLVIFKVGVEYVCGKDTIVDVKLLEIDRDDLDIRPRIWGRHRVVSELGVIVLRNDREWEFKRLRITKDNSELISGSRLGYRM